MLNTSININANVLNKMKEGVHVLGSETGGCVSQNAVNVLHLSWVLVHLFKNNNGKEYSIVARP